MGESVGCSDHVGPWSKLQTSACSVLPSALLLVLGSTVPQWSHAACLGNMQHASTGPLHECFVWGAGSWSLPTQTNGTPATERSCMAPLR